MMCLDTNAFFFLLLSIYLLRFLFLLLISIELIKISFVIFFSIIIIKKILFSIQLYYIIDQFPFSFFHFV
jgi:hypothetical protein